MSKILLIDTETTGLVDPKAFEIAYLGLELVQGYFSCNSTFCKKYNPGKHIELSATAVNHTLDEDVQNCPSINTFVFPECDYIVGHNIDFDWNVLGQPEVKRICTKALSDYLFPELDSHSQSAMLYFFLGKGARERLQNAHTAYQDVLNCLIIFNALIKEAIKQENLISSSIEELYNLSEVARIPTKMKFGKFKGEPFAALDNSYVSWWLYKSDTPPTIYEKKALILAGFRV